MGVEESDDQCPQRGVADLRVRYPPEFGKRLFRVEAGAVVVVGLVQPGFAVVGLHLPDLTHVDLGAVPLVFGEGPADLVDRADLPTRLALGEQWGIGPDHAPDGPPSV